MGGQETNDMFQHLDLNKDKTIDLREFTRFCLEVRYFLSRFKATQAVESQC